MELITTTAQLTAACERLAKHAVITVDTEFLRETTYYPLLCVVQMASAEDALVIDTLAEGIDLKPFFDLMTNESVLKVFHAARRRLRTSCKTRRYHGRYRVPARDDLLSAAVRGADRVCR